jgi:hypothetical protein
MRGWADVLVEAKHRRLDMKKLRPYLERETSARKTPESE